MPVRSNPNCFRSPPSSLVFSSYKPTCIVILLFYFTPKYTSCFHCISCNLQCRCSSALRIMVPHETPMASQSSSIVPLLSASITGVMPLFKLPSFDVCQESLKTSSSTSKMLLISKLRFRSSSLPRLIGLLEGILSFSFDPSTLLLYTLIVYPSRRLHTIYTLQVSSRSFNDRTI